MLDYPYQKKIAIHRQNKMILPCRVELKSFDEDGRFAGYASVFGLVDNQRDIVISGAFRKSVRHRAGMIKLLWQHDPTEPIGYFTQIFEDAQGLYVEGQLMLNVKRAQEAYSLLKKGVVNGLSIGYSPVRYAVDPDSGVRKLSEVDLWEISLVTFPANAQAKVTVVKGLDKDMGDYSDNEWKQFQKMVDYAIGIAIG